MFLIDTNIISEVRKGARCDSRVGGWYPSTARRHVDDIGEGLIRSDSKRELLSSAPMLREASSEEGCPERG